MVCLRKIDCNKYGKADNNGGRFESNRKKKKEKKQAREPGKNKEKNTC